MKKETKTGFQQFLGIILVCMLAFTGWLIDADARENLPGKVSIPKSFSSLAESVRPAVVNIRTEKVTSRGNSFQHFPRHPFGQDDPFNEFFKNFFGDNFQRERKERSLGSGFIIDQDGYIVTNNHVIENADKIKVILKNGKEYDAIITGRDPKTDLALIKIIPDTKLISLKLGNSENLKIGQWVVAIGSPFGLEQTVTAGIVSAKGRVIGSGPYDDFIQTDASINPGNSGGPLLDLEGKVVGINTAIVAGGQGIGFAIPVDLAKGIISQLKTHGTVIRGFLGVTIQNISKEMAEYYGLKDGKGTLVAEVAEDSPADEADIRVGDIILLVNKKKVKDSRALSSIIADTAVGNIVELKVLRDGREKYIKVEIDKLDDTKISQGKIPGREDDLGIGVANLTNTMAEQFNLKDKKGVIITDVEPGSKGDKAGILHGDIIKEVNHETIKSVTEYRKVIQKIRNGDPIQIFIKRRNMGFIVIRMTK